MAHGQSEEREALSFAASIAPTCGQWAIMRVHVRVHLPASLRVAVCICARLLSGLNRLPLLFRVRVRCLPPWPGVHLAHHLIVVGSLIDC